MFGASFFWLKLGVLIVAAGAVALASAPERSNAAGGGAVALAAGFAHTCVVTADGGVKCWGDNTFGQLGDGTQVDRAVPANVSGLGDSVSAVSTSGIHTCAVSIVGGVACWGDNRYWQLGSDVGANCDPPDIVPLGITIPCSTVPVPVLGIGGRVVDVAAGLFHTCVALEDGGVKCWGGNFGGQLGDGTTTPSLHPVDVIALEGPAVSLSAGAYHTCASFHSGTVQCWGMNRGGQLGHVSEETCEGNFFQMYPCSTVPTAVPGLSQVALVETGENVTCALTTGGALYCWGKDPFQDPTTACGPVECRIPRLVPGLDGGAVALTLGFRHGCALLSSTGARCWGPSLWGTAGGWDCWPAGDCQSAVDVCATEDAFGATCARYLAGLREVAAGFGHSCALAMDGGVKCWGYNFAGQLGNGDVGEELLSRTPTDVVGLKPETPPTVTPTRVVTPTPPPTGSPGDAPETPAATLSSGGRGPARVLPPETGQARGGASSSGLEMSDYLLAAACVFTAVLVTISGTFRGRR